MVEAAEDAEVVVATMTTASSFFRNDHWIGQRVRNKTNKWFGRVMAVECLVCGANVNEGFACGHVKFGYHLTIGQLITSTGEWYLKPWCRVQDYEDATERLTVWERLLDDEWLDRAHTHP